MPKTQNLNIILHDYLSNRAELYLINWRCKILIIKILHSQFTTHNSALILKLVGKIKFKIMLRAFRYRLSAVGFGKKHGCGQ